MKYGDQLEHESVPQWSLHNLDYNSLKHEIKAHTTRAQASAMAIPGSEDASLRRFEDGFYVELCRQHDRLHLFVTSKADEISRRLDALSRSVDRWIAGASSDETSLREMLRRQRRFARHERELMRLGDDVQDLSRFANAQIVAFRKIVKKYRKWTGSTTLGTRLAEDVLGNPKSFTRRDFGPIRRRQQDMLATLRDANPQLFSDGPSSPSSDGNDTLVGRPGSSGAPHPDLAAPPLPPPAIQPQEPRQQQVKYWNEYDDGSESGDVGYYGRSGDADDRGDYAIYVDPDADSSFIPGLGYVTSALAAPLAELRRWLGRRPAHLTGERRPLLGGRSPARAAAAAVDSDAEEGSDGSGYESSEDLPPLAAGGYAVHYTLPSLSDQKAARLREAVLFWTTLGCYAASLVLLAVSAVLITTSRHKMRVEVDAVVTIVAAISLLCACSALAATLHRADRLALSYRVATWAVFVAVCLLNGMLLVVVAGNSP